MTVPIISKHAREIGISPTVAGLIGKQLILHTRGYFVHFISTFFSLFVLYFNSSQDSVSNYK